jgi:hemoglobin-like flavoprotein
MVMHTKLPIHKAGSELLAVVTKIEVQMERGYKRSVGGRIVSHCAQMLDLMAEANQSRGNERVQYLRAILKHQRMAEEWLRVALELKKVADDHWAQAIQKLDSVGKQANGWIAKTNGVPAV